jgi:ribosomal protein L20
MKIYNISFVGSCENNLSYSFNRIPNCITFDMNNRKEAFKELRKQFLLLFQKAQKLNLQSYANYKFGLAVTTIDIKKDVVKNKNYYINPLNLKIQ